LAAETFIADKSVGGLGLKEFPIHFLDEHLSISISFKKIIIVIRWPSLRPDLKVWATAGDGRRKVCWFSFRFAAPVTCKFSVDCKASADKVESSLGLLEFSHQLLCFFPSRNNILILSFLHVVCISSRLCRL
jgi:hypothetical protein